MPNTAEFMLNRLSEWGIERIYGYPGDGINGLLGAFHEVGDRIEFTQTAHEEIASFAACAHAKFTGEVGVCMATSGPGAIHLLNGLYDAKLDHQPVQGAAGRPNAPRVALSNTFLPHPVPFTPIRAPKGASRGGPGTTPRAVRPRGPRPLRWD
jgi:pyruvate dehydrogenase (quinone)